MADIPDWHFEGSRDLIVNALRNLIDNAVNYSNDATRVGVGAKIDDEQISISVTDQGIGLTKEDTERVFERFYRVDPARSRMTGGTGLGLSIVKHIMASHSGHVSVWSELGQGSTFTITLPMIGMVEDSQLQEAKSQGILIDEAGEAPVTPHTAPRPAASPDAASTDAWPGGADAPAAELGDHDTLKDDVNPQLGAFASEQPQRNSLT